MESIYVQVAFENAHSDRRKAFYTYRSEADGKWYAGDPRSSRAEVPMDDEVAARAAVAAHLRAWADRIESLPFLQARSRLTTARQ